MPGSTPSRCSRNSQGSIVPMSERQQLKLVRQLEVTDNREGNLRHKSDRGVQRIRTKSCNGRGETALHKAAIRGDPDLVNKLLEEGADPNVPDFAGWTPLHEACNHGWLEIAETLIEAGASVNAKGLDDDTPLHDAAVNGHTQLVKLLIENGADVNSKNKSGKTPYDVAAPCLAFLFNQSFFSVNNLSEVHQSCLSHQNRKRSYEKFESEDSTCSRNQKWFITEMEEKNCKDDVYEFKSSKEATPVRGTSASPEAEKSNNEPKNEKTSEGLIGESETVLGKRTLLDLNETDDVEDETKRKKRKEGDGKIREEGSLSSKSSSASGRTAGVRNASGSSEKTGKTSSHSTNKSSGLGSKSVSCSATSGAGGERKSPSSPKGSTSQASHTSTVTSGSGTSKTESDVEEKVVADGEKIDQAPKVPPLKIVIPQQTASEPEQGNRNGKNGPSRHHQALPYVVSSNGNDGEKEGLRSRSASPVDSSKLDEKKDPAIGMLSAEDQKGSLHHQRVLRSAHRSGPPSNSESRVSESTPPAGARSSAPCAQLPTPASASMPSVSLSSANSNSSASAGTESQSPPSLGRSSPAPQGDPTPVSSASLSGSCEGVSSSQNSSSSYRTSTPAKANGSSSTALSTSSQEEKSVENASESGMGSSQSTSSNSAPVELHPRKRKLKHNKEVKESNVAQGTSERCESTTISTEVHPHEQPVKNCYQLFLDIRKQIERRRKGLFPVQPKPPQGFKDYLMNRCTYVLAGNASTRQIPSSPLPQNISSPMKELFADQEKERHRLRLQHVIEKEKLVLSVEQEILRVHGRAARALANQSLPFSACTILKDEEVYNLITPEQEEKDRNARSRYNGRLFLSWLQDVDDKWEKIKEAMLLRHHNEAESLHAVQKMDWEWKLKESGYCEFKSKPVILDSHVPMVHVSDDFDLLPA